MKDKAHLVNFLTHQYTAVLHTWQLIFIYKHDVVVYNIITEI